MAMQNGAEMSKGHGCNTGQNNHAKACSGYGGRYRSKLLRCSGTSSAALVLFMESMLLVGCISDKSPKASETQKESTVMEDEPLQKGISTIEPPPLRFDSPSKAIYVRADILPERQIHLFVRNKDARAISDVDIVVLLGSTPATELLHMTLSRIQGGEHFEQTVRIASGSSVATGDILETRVERGEFGPAPKLPADSFWQN